MEPKLIHGKQGLDARLPRIGIRQTVDSQASASDVNPIGDPDVNLGEFDAALEAS